MSVLDPFRRLAHSPRFGYAGGVLLLTVAAVAGVIGGSTLQVSIYVAVAWLTIATAYWIQKTDREVPA